MTRVLVCGGRDFADRDLLFRTLNEIAGVSEANMLGEHLVIIHGACPTGADALADRWAVSTWNDVDTYPADWAKHGRAAGPIRNGRMIKESTPDLVVAFPGGRGTADMCRQAEAAGIEVRRVGVDAMLGEEPINAESPSVNAHGVGVNGLLDAIRKHQAHIWRNGPIGHDEDAELYRAAGLPDVVARGGAGPDDTPPWPPIEQRPLKRKAADSSARSMRNLSLAPNMIYQCISLG